MTGVTAQPGQADLRSGDAPGGSGAGDGLDGGAVVVSVRVEHVREGVGDQSCGGLVPWPGEAAAGRSRAERLWARALGSIRYDLRTGEG